MQHIVLVVVVLTIYVARGFANMHGLLCVCFTCQRPAHVVFESMCLLIVACPGILWVRLHVQWACCIYGNVAIMAGVVFYIYFVCRKIVCEVT